MSDIPPSQPTGYLPPARERSSGMATASLVLGIISLILCCVPYVSIPAAILAIIFGAIARNRVAAGIAEGRSMATAGMVCGIIAIVLGVIFVAGCLTMFGLAGKHLPAIQKELEEMQRQMEQQQTRPATGPTVMLDHVWSYARARVI